MMVEELVDEPAGISVGSTTDSPELPAAKRVALVHATALAGLTLQLVMQFAGSNEGIFIANVCHSWEMSYKSTYKDEIWTHHASCMTSLHRVRWIWPKPVLGSDTFCCLFWSGENEFAWYLGKYAPASVVKAAILDDKLVAIDSGYLVNGLAAGDRLRLMLDLWDDHVKAHPTKGLSDTVAKIGVEAAKFGALKILGLAWSRIEGGHKNQCGGNSAHAAARQGHVNILEFPSLTDWWSSDDGPTGLGEIAAASNQLEVLRWLPAHGHAREDTWALAAGAGGEASTLNFLLENGCPGFDEAFVACCVKHDRIEALQWCYDTLRTRIAGIWTEENLKEWLLLAGTFNETDAAKFLLEHGALWPSIGQRFGETIYYHISFLDGTTAESSHVCAWSPSFLEWAMAEGCTFGTWSTATCARLTKDADWTDPLECPLLEILSWAHSHNCPCLCARGGPDF